MWSPLPRGGAIDGVNLTVTAKAVNLTIGYRALVALGWDLVRDPENAATVRNYAVSIGDEDHLGWVRVDLFEEGLPAEAETDEEISFVFAPTTLPGLPRCRTSPLVWRIVEGGLEIRLPDAQVTRRRGAKSTAAATAAPVAVLAARHPATVPSPRAELAPIGTPPEYRDTVKNAYAAGFEIAFLNNGKVLVNGKQLTVEQMQERLRRAA